jgi:multidrug efflux pump subunit AcrB
MRRILEHFARQHIFVNILVIVVFILGIMALFRLNKEAFPDVDLDSVVIMTIYPGATSSEIEKFITKPLEDEIRGIPNIDEVSSTSTEGRSIIVVELEEGLSDIEKSDVYNDLRNAIDRAKKDFPDDAEEPTMTIIRSGLLPVLKIGLYSNKASYREIRKWADVLEKLLLDIDGISSVSKQGYFDREFLVSVLPKRLKEFNITLGQIVNILKLKNVSIPAGSLEAPTNEYLVRTVGEFRDYKDVANTVIRVNEEGKAIKIRDIAIVSDTFKEPKVYERTDGGDSIILKCIKKEKADIIKVVDDIYKVLDRFNKMKPSYIKYKMLADVSYFVKRRLRVLKSNAYIGLIFVVLVLYFFLGFRISFVTALGLPVAFLGTFAFMMYYGITINLMSLFGLIIVLGMLVDDAIIVSENIYRYLQQGKGLIESAGIGAYEVFYPVLSTILTTIAAFIPLMLIGGMMGKFTWQIAAVVIIALSISLLEAFFVLPSHIIEVQSIGKSNELKKSLADRLKVMDFLKKWYEKIISISLRLRYITIIIAIMLFVGSILLVKYGIDIVMFPSEGIEEFMVKMEAPAGTPLDKTKKLVKQVEDIILKLPKNELIGFNSRVGILQRSPFDKTTRVGSRFAVIIAYLTPPQQRKRSADEIVNALRKEVKKKVKGFEKIEFVRRKPGPPVGMPIEIRIKGDDMDKILHIANLTLNKLKAMKGIKDPSIDYQEGKEEITIRVNEEKARLAGVNVSDISLAIKTAIEGTVATEIKRQDEEINVRVRFPKSARKDLNTILDIKIQNKLGNLIPLRELVYTKKHKTIFAIYHLNFKRSVAVVSDIDEKVTTVQKVVATVDKFLQPILHKYPGYTVEYGGEFKETTKSLRDLMMAFVVAVFLILLILATQFRSLIYPFIIMLAIPFGFIGVSLIFFLHGKPFSFMALLGIVALSGVVVNDSIVLVSFFLDLKEKISDTFSAIKQAGIVRLRPVLLTTITTAFGLMPTAYGIGGFDPFVSPAALAMAWGIVFATGITLIVIPVVLYIVEDIKGATIRAFRKK